MCGLQCPKRLWQAVYDPERAEEPLPGTAKGMGIEVGIKARLLWPGGVLVDDPENGYYDAAVRRTKTLIADPAVPAILEATLVYDGVLVRVDALERLPNGRWRVNEVKSSTRIKDEYLKDLALQVYVLAGNDLERGRRLWRADRVLATSPSSAPAPGRGAFTIRDYLGRAWLRDAMQEWAQRAPVRIRLTPAQAELLQRDWFYRHAEYVSEPAGAILMTYGEDNPAATLELVRWLGPGAELLEPQAWRVRLREELEGMQRMYEGTT